MGGKEAVMSKDEVGLEVNWESGPACRQSVCRGWADTTVKLREWGVFGKARWTGKREDGHERKDCWVSLKY